MCIDPLLVEKIGEFIDVKYNDPSICYPVNVTGRGKSKEKMILFTNESNIIVFDNKNQSKFINPLLNKTWFQLKRIVSNDEYKLQLHFDKGYFEIESDVVPLIIYVVVRYICNILVDKEIPEVDLETFDYTTIQKSRYAAYYRLRALIFTESFQYSLDTILRFKDFLGIAYNEIDVYTIDPIGSHIPYILRALQVNPKISKLIVQTPMKGVIWKDLGDFVAYNQTIKSIVTYEPITNDFEFFIQGFQQNSRSKIDKLAIMNAKVTRKYVLDIEQLLQARQLSSLELNNCLAGPTAIEFIETFEKSAQMQQIRHLSLDNSKNLDLYQLLRVTKSLDSLSVNECGIEICLFFGFLAYFPDVKLKEISINGNQAKAALKSSLKIPTSIKKLSITNTFFAGDNILRLLVLLAPLRANIDLSHAQNLQTNWNSLAREFDLIEKPQFTGLGWAGNPVELQTLDFFDRCENLSMLNISGCIREKSSSFPEIIKFLSENDTIEKLKISQGKPTDISVSSMPLIFSLIKDNRNIKSVDISGHPITDDLLKNFSEALMTNLSIFEVNFSLTECKSGPAVVEFYNKLESRFTPLHLPPPNFDMKRLRHKKQISEADEVEIFRIIEAVSYGNKNAKPPVDSFTPMVRVEKQRRVPPCENYRIPTDDEVIQKMANEKDDAAEWEVIQDQIPHIDTLAVTTMLQQTMNIDMLIASVSLGL